MSAWIVSRKHIDYMVTALIAAELIAPRDANKTGRMLWRECLRSVAYRYPNDTDGTRPGPVEFRDGDVDTYVWEETPVLIGGALAKTIHCYTYQSCECPDWPSTEAYRFCERLDSPDIDSKDWPPEEEVPWGW